MNLAKLIVYNMPVDGVPRTVVIGVLVGEAAVILPDNRRHIVLANSHDGQVLSEVLTANVAWPMKDGNGHSVSTLLHMLGDAEVES